jgi:hypothetical protein
MLQEGFIAKVMVEIVGLQDLQLFGLRHGTGTVTQ